MKKIYLSILASIVALMSFAQTPIITMIADGDCTGGNPKVLEIYASGAVDFANYTLQNQTNANTTWGSPQSLAALGVVTNAFVYVYYESTVGVFASEFPSAVNVLSSSTVNFNGDDRVRIIETTSTNVVDQYGVTDVDGTGMTWEYTDGYARRNNGTGPDAAFVEANWSINKLSFDGLGLCQGGTSTFGALSGAGTYSNVLTPQVYFKTDSFEFNEGAGTVSLDTLLISPALVSPAMTDQFEIHLKAGSTATVADFDVTGLPIPITFPQTVPLGLFNFTAQALDVTLIDDALIEGSEWVAIVLRNAVGLNIGADSVIYLKIIDNDFPMDTFVELTSMSATVGEGDGTYNIALDYQQTGVNPNHTVDLQLITGDVADIDNYTTQTVTFNSLTQSVTITITDDLLVEPTETLTFALVNATNGLMIGSDSIFTLNITNNDVATYDLGLIDGNNATGGDSTGLVGKFIGVVNSLDRGFATVGDAVEFSIQSATGSVDVYSNVAPFSTLAPAVGDELEIVGTVKFFNGMVRIENLVSVNTLSTGNAVVPVVATAVTDANESTLIRINALKLVDPAQWFGNNLSSGFDVFALNTSGDTVMIRIDRDYLALYNSAAPNSAMIDVIGVASQYDATTPYDKFHQIIPRDLNDIILYPTLNFAAQGTSVNEDAGTVTVNFAVANDNGGSYTVDVALTSGDAADLGGFANLTAVTITGGVGSFTVNVTDDALIEATENFIFTVSNPSAGLLLGAGKTFDLTVTDNDANGIKDINVNDLRVYPNPTSHTLKLDFISNEAQISTIQIVNIAGQVVATKTVILNYGQNNMTFDVSKFAKGNYVVNIATEAGKHARKYSSKIVLN